MDATTLVIWKVCVLALFLPETVYSYDEIQCFMEKTVTRSVKGGITYIVEDWIDKCIRKQQPNAGLKIGKHCRCGRRYDEDGWLKECDEECGSGEESGAPMTDTVHKGDFHSKCDFKDKPCPLPFTKRMQEKIVDYHNELRRKASPHARDMQKMYWDDTMAKMAQKNAEKCDFMHTSNAGLRFSGYANVGQNLFASSDNPSVLSPVKDWYSEKEFFTYGEKSSETVGHYTQVVQGPAARVGCGGAYCPNFSEKYLVTCNYLQGQYDFTKPYRRGKICGTCPKSCKNKLCDCGGKACQHGGILNLNTCKCKCQQNTGGDLCEIITCEKRENKSWCSRNKKYCNLDEGFFNFRYMCTETCGLCK